MTCALGQCRFQSFWHSKMPSAFDDEQLLLQQNPDDFREAESSRWSLQSFASNAGDQEIVEAPADDNYDEEDAAFHAVAEAFVRKCDAHETAVRRLLQDLVEDDETEASAKGMNALPASNVRSSSVRASDDGADGPSKLGEADDMESSSWHGFTGALEAKIAAGPGKNCAKGEIDGLLDDSKQHQASKGLGDNHNRRKHPQANKRHAHLMKAVAQEKSSSCSPPSNSADSPKSASERKIATKPAKARANLFSSRRSQEEIKGHCISENEISQKKAREPVPLMKPAAGLSQRWASRDEESIVLREMHSADLNHENLDFASSLLKLAKQAIACEDKPQKALDYATRAAKAFKLAADGKSSLELIMCSHVLAALHCSLAQYDEAVKVLENSLNLPVSMTSGQDHALAAFAGYMQLGDTLSLLGKGEESLTAYCKGLQVQIGALGENDPRIGETCRYLAEAHAQALQFDTAEQLCQKTLDIHQQHSIPASAEEATDRRLMGLIYNGKGQHKAALEQLVLASMALVTNSRDVDVATVDASIGDTYVLLGRLDEAATFYQKALKVLKTCKGKSQPAVASLYISLGQIYLKTGKLRESKAYCESALRLYMKQISCGHSLEEIASGLTEIAIIYESLNEGELAFSFLQKAIAIREEVPGQQSAVAAVEAQIGVFHYLHGDYKDARDYFGKAVSKLRRSAEKNSPLFGVVLNQMGLACVQLADVQAAVILFEESRTILEAVCGLHHPDTLSVCSNLAGAFDALGRLDDAIAVLQHTLEARAEIGPADMEVEDERARLAELLKEAGQIRARKCHSKLASSVQGSA